ncbi:MAG TPA: hypothetical protein VGC00_08200 [Thermoanaerobaculia bacterium]
MPHTQDPAAGRVATRLLVFAATVLLVALAIVVGSLGIAAIAGGAVHESEARSLAGVVLFPGHALRELPHLVLLALLWLGAAGAPRDGRELGRRLAALGVLTAACGAALFAAAAAESGAALAWQDLAQSRAARDLAGPGVHFRFHLLSDLALGGLLFAVGRTVGPADGGRERRVRLGAVAVAGGLFAAALAAWGIESVATPRFVGHAGREILTFALLALPVLWALALRGHGTSLALRRALGERDVRLALAVAALGAGGLGWHALGVDLLAASSAPSRSLALNLAAHQFEHLFDVAFLAAAGRIASGGRRVAVGAVAEGT